MFDDSLMETIFVCSGGLVPNCTETQRKDTDEEGNRTLVGQVLDNTYQQVLSQPPYNLNINIIRDPNP